MNLKTIIYSFTIFLIALVNVYAKETIINGKVEGKLPTEIRYTAPVNGSMGFDMHYSVKPDVQGNFVIKCDLTDITVIDLYYDLKPAGSVIATPGESYSIIINRDNKENPFAVQGKSSEYQKLYNKMYGNYKMVLVHDYSQQFWKKTAAEIKQELKKNADSDNAKLDELLKSSAIPKDVYNYLKQERRYFLACAAGYGSFVKSGMTLREPNPDIANVMKQWCDFYTGLPADGIGINKTPWGYLFLDGYVNYKWLEAGNFDYKRAQEIDVTEIVKKNIPPQYMEFYMASDLNNNIVEGFKDESMVTAFNLFKQTYPNSTYIKLLEPGMDPIIKLHSTSTNLTESTAFVDNYSAINSLDGLIKKFNGKKLYFDVWATWCGPCRQEFAHKDALYKLLKENGVTIVYISIDNNNKEEEWKKMINYYGLEGQHIRAGEQLNADLRKIFDNNGSISIPWYMLVGADGKLPKKHASPPSKIDRLKEEIGMLK
ncbi:redoxin family protein [Flavobacterium sp. Sd200]|uniref:TlpA family protein disulfide reductase n=1 Tax=Flavobacterium sp. Sd200 TaxID=2692211 RepID=UPI001368CF19|nr:TlpA disulfide reductase family protein [Flavobacterium sp. Sd200]MXN91016.1 redoxin family protein [Flavobacterium sp. Sd200]